MRGLIADVNFHGHLDRLVYIFESDFWWELWDDLEISVVTFASLGLHRETKDRIVWERCQSEGLILVTGNRNDDGPDSLEATPRSAGVDSLPVITIGDGQRLLEDSADARRIASQMMDLLDDLVARPETVLGIGRIFLPR